MSIPTSLTSSFTATSSASTTASTTASTNTSFMSTMLNGFSFGVGQSIAHNSINKIFNWGGNSNRSDNSISPNPINKSCEDLNKQFTECLDFNGNSHITCESVLKSYELCLKEKNY